MNAIANIGRFVQWSTLGLLTASMPMVLLGQAPSWWSDRGVINTSGTANDYAAVNQGQVKNIAVNAVYELDDNFWQFSGTNGAILDALAVTLSSTTGNTNDYAAVNLGQLKAVAKPFFDTLLAGGYRGHPLESGSYPWVGGTVNDYAMANIGQVKNLFSFDVTLSSDGSGLPDWWEQLYGITLGSGTTATSLAPRGDGLSYLDAYQQGLNPMDFFNGQAPRLAIASGTNQTGSPGAFVPNPLIVTVTDSSNKPIPGAPVTFTASQGALQATSNGTNAGTLTVYANAYGRAIAYFELPNTLSTQCQITCTPASGGYAGGVIFVESSDDGSGTFHPPTLPPTEPGGDGGSPGNSPPQIPMLSYAAIDISGNHTEGQDVQMMVLDDLNKAAFAYTSGTNCVAYTWANGSAAYSQSLTLNSETYYNIGTALNCDRTISYTPSYLTSNGIIYGTQTIDYATYPLYYPGDDSLAGQLSQIPPGVMPQNAGAYTVYLTYTDPDPITGAEGRWDTIYWILNAGSALGFSSQGGTPSPIGGTISDNCDYLNFSISGGINNVYYGTTSGTTQINGNTCGTFPLPSVINSNGWAIASGTYWNGSSTSLPGVGTGINDSNTIIGYYNQSGGGWLMPDGGGVSNIADLLPSEFKSMVQNIRPNLISNADSNGSVNILFAATDVSSGASGNYLLKMNTSGSNTLAQLKLPKGVNASNLSINANGLIAAIGTTASTSGANQHALGLLPVDIAVDANRDGVIKFAGNFNDPNTASSPADTTSQDKPYRFWLNDDNDSNEMDHPGSSTKDSDSNTIVSVRDLEDFTRLWINIGGLQDAIAAGTITVGLEWRNVTSGSPSIKVFAAVENSGSTAYLTDASLVTAGNQMGATAVGTITSGGSFQFPTSFWQADALSGRPIFSGSNPNRYLLFEGCTEGTGQLVLTFWQGSQKIGEGGSVWLDLKNIKKMYERAIATPDTLVRPYNSNSSTFDDSGFHYTIDTSNAYQAPADEQKTALVFVHGWNMSYNDYVNYSETMFKRLWWQGYKGKFCAFRWATLTDLDSYNTSEYRAWKYGKSLKDYVASLNNYTVSVAAHSMGNVVTGSALQRGMGVNRYFLMEAAIPGGCYNDAVNNYPDFLTAEQTKPTPDTGSDLGYRLYVGSAQNNAQKTINFYNTQDFALFSGAYPVLGNVSWEQNQKDYKPNGFSTNTYAYDKGPPNNPYPAGQRCFLRGIYSFSERPVLDIHESMSFVARPRSKAIGAEPSSTSVFPQSIDLQGYGFGGQQPDHGGQFNRGIQQLNDFYKIIFNEIK